MGFKSRKVLQLGMKPWLDYELQWFARGGGIARSGPYGSEVEAWEAMELTEVLQSTTGYKHPLDAVVWPERKRLED